jgi:hypothetical protein
MIDRPGPSFPSSIENYVALTSAQYELGSLILMVSYGAQFAFILYFLGSAMQLAPRYRVVPILSAVIMLSSGLSLLRRRRCGRTPTASPMACIARSAKETPSPTCSATATG